LNSQIAATLSGGHYGAERKDGGPPRIAIFEKTKKNKIIYLLCSKMALRKTKDKYKVNKLKSNLLQGSLPTKRTL
jgi:hypothetical protein